MMETKGLSHEIPDYGLDSDGLLSWEEFYGSSNEDLVESFLEMYDLLIGRSTEIKEDLINSQRQTGFEKLQTTLEEAIKTKDVNKEASLDSKKRNDNWCDIIKQNWNCRCIEKSAIKPITRCAACDSEESEIRSTEIRESQISKSETLRSGNPNCLSEPSLSLFQDQNLSKCELVTCPAGFSTPSTPVQQRFKRLVNQLPFPFRWVARPSSVSSLGSSSSSSSGGSSCYGAKRLEVPNKSSSHLASIESLEDDSDREDLKDKSSRFSKETGGSEDSGVHSLCTSLPQDKPKYCDPHLSYMDKVVTEIIETEEVYVGDLRKIIEGYLMKWRSLSDFPLSDLLDNLFGNIEAVFNFNSLFLKELKCCGLDPVKVARCFVKHNAGFSVYTEYCTNYPTTVSLLTELMRKEGIVRLFRERQTALQHTLPLGSYLLKPVQRILKYHLLLQNMVKQYSNGIEGYKDIMDALRTMTEIAQHINDMKRRHEHEVRVQEIQSLLLGWEGEDLTTFGELCAEGAFRICGAKALRHVFLFDKMLLITKKKEGGTLDYKTHINCSNLMLIESVPGEPLSFHVIPFDNPRLLYTLQCRNLEQKREWTWQIKRAILENYNAVIPSHARQLVMELGQSKSEDDIQTNKILPKRHHLAPEYLEKRKQERGKTDASFKSRLRRSKKSEAGNKSEDQFNKSETTEEENHSQGTENETENVQLLDEKRADSPDKLEIKTLEQIVTQILKQNREFDKVLKRQKHILARTRDLNIRRKRKKEANRSGKTVQETLRNLNVLKSTQKETANPEKEYDSSYNSERDTLLQKFQDCENGALKAKEFRRSLSFPQAESSEKIEDDFQKIPLDDGIPTSPSVWLRQQDQHLPVAPKKAGSLPRSFQITSESSQNDSRFFRDFRVSIERPFTIASDKISSTMLFEGMERFYRGQFRRSNSSTTDDGSLTDGLRTPGASLDHINIHPEYKIYNRSGLSASILKSMLSSMHNKLSHIKMDVAQKLEPEKKVLTRERKASRVIYMLAKHYHKTLRNKQKGKSFENDSDSCNQLVLSSASLPVYKQGSESLGARLANFTESECRISRLRCSKKAASLLGVYADSVLSLQSTPKNTPKNPPAINRSDDSKITSKDQSNAVDCFYERRFEEMDEELSKNLRLQDQEMDDEKTEGGSQSDQTPPLEHAKPNRESTIVKMTKRSRDRLLVDTKAEEEEGLRVSNATTAPVTHKE